MAVAAAAGAALCGITADAAVYQLDEIIVNGDKYTDDTIMPGGKTDRRIHFGLYGNMDLMDVPANIASYTEKTIKQNYIPARTFMNTVTNNPSWSAVLLPIIMWNFKSAAVLSIPTI